VAGIGEADTFAPLTTLTYKAGITDKADVFVGWHVLETFLNGGNAYFDIGASYYFLEQKGARPGLSGAFTISPLINKTSGWASFDLQVTASWAFGPRERHLLYVGFHNYFAPVRNDTVPTSPYTWTPYIGGQLRVGKNRELGLGLEMKWHRPYASTENSVMGYIGPGKMGALAFLGGITIFIGKDMKPAPDLEQAIESMAPDETAESPVPDETTESSAPDETIESPTPPEDSESAGPDEVDEGAGESGASGEASGDAPNEELNTEEEASP